jgi:2-keto-4-pentenoate hydratase
MPSRANEMPVRHPAAGRKPREPRLPPCSTHASSTGIVVSSALRTARYRPQGANFITAARRKTSRGRKLAGLKAGLTSHAKMKQMGVTSPVFGFMTDDYLVADNTSAAHFVIGGQPTRAEQVDLRTVGVVLEKNGEVVAVGAGAAVLGHPAAALAMLANHLGARGQEIPAGTLVLSGGVTEAVSVKPGDAVTLRVQGMGSTSMRFV